MKTREYCGQPSDETSVTCPYCATELPLVADVPVNPYLAAFGAATILIILAGGLAVLLLSRKIAPAQLRGASSTGAAWVRGSARQMIGGVFLGVLLGLCYLAIALLLARQDGERTSGPLAALSSSPRWPQIEWLIAGLLLAPPIEELLFRGVLFAGYNYSYGPIRATLITTLIFCLLHVTEAIHFLPSFIGIAALALAALWLRLRSAAIGPAVAVHFGYNATLGPRA